MAKKKSKKQKPQPKIEKSIKPRLKKRISLAVWQKHLIFCSILGLVLMIFFGPLVFNDHIYPDDDNREVIVANHKIKTFQQETGEIAYWNPYPWGGVPNLFNIPRSLISPDYYLEKLAELLSAPFIYFLWGALGFYFLCILLKFDAKLSLLAALLFIFAPYYKSLLIVGHQDKVQAIMHMPWVIWATLRLIKNQHWSNGLLFAMMLGLQVRANHYQIVFYTGFFVLSLIVAHSISEIKTRNWNRLIKRSGHFLVFGALALLISANPLFITFKHSADSVRAGGIINMAEPSSAPEKGVSKKLIAQWSMAPSELASLLIPRAKGGLSDEDYKNASKAGFRDDRVGAYWGHSPFNGSYYYIGAIVFLLLLYGIRYSYKDRTFIALFAISALMIVWALGTFSGFLNDIFYTLIPFYKNLRTPPTSLSLLYLTLPIAAAYGLRGVAQNRNESLKKSSWPILVALVTGMLIWILISTSDFLKNGEDSNAAVVNALQEIRRQMHNWDTLRYILLIICSVGVLVLFKMKKMSFPLLLLALAAMMFYDFLSVQNRYPANTIAKDDFEEIFLEKTSGMQFLSDDASTFRVLSLGRGNFSLPYFVQCIGGGYELQMNKNAYEVYNYCLYQKLDGRIGINWNILDMLNVKYVVSDREVDHQNLSLVHTDQQRRLFFYRYRFNKPRAFFVDRFEVVPGASDRIERLNDRQTNLRTTVLLDRPPRAKINPVSRSHTEVLSFSNNMIQYNVNAPSQGLLVLSEIFAPDIQRIFIDGELVNDIYKANHMLPAIIVPGGFHTIELRYKGDLFSYSKWISTLGWLLTYLGLGFFLFTRRNKIFSFSQ